MQQTAVKNTYMQQTAKKTHKNIYAADGGLSQTEYSKTSL